MQAYQKLPPKENCYCILLFTASHGFSAHIAIREPRSHTLYLVYILDKPKTG